VADMMDQYIQAKYGPGDASSQGSPFWPDFSDAN